MQKREIGYWDGVLERLETVSLPDLTEAERTCFAVELLYQEVSNGGVGQYLNNASGEYAAEALSGLDAIGASKACELLAAVVALFPGGTVPRDQESRWEAMQADEAFEDKLEQLEDSALWDETWEQAMDLLAVYTQAHDAEFLGPRTHLDLWHSQRARGADTQPLDYRDRDLAREAVIDARYTDRLCPNCGQPASVYRAFCKRCGYPYGKAPR